MSQTSAPQSLMLRSLVVAIVVVIAATLWLVAWPAWQAHRALDALIGFVRSSRAEESIVLDESDESLLKVSVEALAAPLRK